MAFFFSKLVCIFLAYISLISLPDAAILQKEKLRMYTNILRIFLLL